MKSLPLVLITLLVFCPSISQADDNLTVGESISRNQERVSTDGKIKLRLDGNGILTLRLGNVPLWKASNTPADTLIMQGDGNLVLYQNGGNPVWASGTAGKTADTLVVQGDGNLVIYNQGQAIWATNTNGATGQRTFPFEVSRGGDRWRVRAKISRTGKIEVHLSVKPRNFGGRTDARAFVTLQDKDGNTLWVSPEAHKHKISGVLDDSPGWADGYSTFDAPADIMDQVNGATLIAKGQRNVIGGVSKEDRERLWKFAEEAGKTVIGSMAGG